MHVILSFFNIVPSKELWNFRSHGWERKYHRWNFRSLELSPLYQYEKRIAVALGTKECSSLPTNVALQSEVVIERIDKLQL